MLFSKKSTAVFPAAVVGTIYSRASLDAALKVRPGGVDFLELRVDAFAADGTLDRLEASIPRLKAPLIVTVRHPLEGGAGELSVAQRRVLFERFLPHATLVDVELRSATALKAVRQSAQERGVEVILSHHDFQKTPSLARLVQLHTQAAKAGSAVFKVATMARSARDLAVLIEFLTAARPGRPRLAVMGMGAFGKVSRLALATAGSVLNYGCLDQPQVPGQWPARLLKERLLELA